MVGFRGEVRATHGWRGFSALLSLGGRHHHLSIRRDSRASNSNRGVYMLLTFHLSHHRREYAFCYSRIHFLELTAISPLARL
jgi:hypothetical protein